MLLFRFRLSSNVCDENGGASASACCLIGSFLVLFLGSDVLGARRELNFGFMSLQPSEFLKPGFAILAAAVLADRAPMVLPKPLITFF